MGDWISEWLRHSWYVLTHTDMTDTYWHLLTHNVTYRRSHSEIFFYIIWIWHNILYSVYLIDYCRVQPIPDQFQSFPSVPVGFHQFQSIPDWFPIYSQSIPNWSPIDIRSEKKDTKGCDCTGWPRPKFENSNQL